MTPHINQRENHLSIIAQVCIENKIYPNNGTAFAGLVRKVAIGHLFVPEAKAKEYTSALKTIYEANKWTPLLSNMEEETEAVESTIQVNKINLVYPQQSVQDEMKKIADKIQSEPVKKQEQKQSIQQDKPTSKQIAQALYNHAKNDTYNDVGRITLYDARDITDNKHLTIQETREIWTQHYPLIDCETKSNVLLIYWSGKEDYKLGNSSQPVIIPSQAPLFSPKEQPQGDILDNIDEGEVNE